MSRLDQFCDEDVYEAGSVPAALARLSPAARVDIALEVLGAVVGFSIFGRRIIVIREPRQRKQLAGG